MNPFIAANLASAAGPNSVYDTRPTSAPLTFEQVIRSLAQAVPNGPIPVFVPFGALRVGLQSPADRIDVPYSPLAGFLHDPGVSAYLSANATESSGSISATITPPAGSTYQIRVLRVHFQTDPDQSGADEALETITWAPSDFNGGNTQLSQATGTPFAVTDGVSTNNELSCRFTLDAACNGGFYVHFAVRRQGIQNGLPKTVPSPAVVAQGAAAPGNFVYTAQTIAAATTGLVSGNLMRKAISAIAPGSPYFEEYVRVMLAHHYGAQV